MPEVKPEAETFAKIKVIGVGGAGGNAINRMIDEGIRGVEFIAINTDVQALNNSKADVKLHIGKTVTRGLGAGMNPELGRQAAEESQVEIKDVLKGADMVFITCGLGGGTGSGASPVIAEISKDCGALTIAVVAKPFAFEGGQRKKIAEKAFEELSVRVDTIIVVSNEKLLQVIDKKTSFLDAFKIADNILQQGVAGIAEIITVPGIVNADFADVKAIMANTGSALMGIGRASGDDRAQEAVRLAVNSNLLDVDIKGAKGIVFTVTGGADLTMMDVNEAANIINSLADEDARIIFGAIIDPNLKDEIKVTIVATGFDRGRENIEPFTRITEPIASPFQSIFGRKADSSSIMGVREEVRVEPVIEVANPVINQSPIQTPNPSIGLSWLEKDVKKTEEVKTTPAINRFGEAKKAPKNEDDSSDDGSDVPAFIRKKMM
ncbi:MAG: cell division protein FtsZ [Candidatus Falkowbacteria bacterium]